MKNLKITTLMCVTLLFISGSIFAQKTNKQALNQFSAEKSLEFEKSKAEALKIANEKSIPVFIQTENSFMELMSIDKNGQPQYYTTNNANAAKTTSTDKVHSGGGAGFNLNGSGMTAHEWDGGAIRITHQELTGRVTQGDGASTTHYHAQHVAGTIIGSGVVASAKGMAPQANLRAFDWNSDESEMATEAANGALVSNHSYGYSNGWSWTGSSWVWYGNTSISTQEDDSFGFYDAQARDWDQIAYNAPNYLIVKSAGNDRGDGPTNGAYPQDGPYDCIANAGVAKNILTVGAVDDIVNGYSQASDVVMSSFSSWGPSDDSRIKPDIVANGVSLYSASDGNNSAYQSLSGTSMSSPAATGSLILLQEHFKSLTGNTVKAATLKALVINTADEAGTTTGPDYSFGWGLMNTLKAAQKISEDQTLNVIEELTLNNGASYSRDVTAKGGEPILVTVVWTDKPGTPVSASLDPTNAMLVNNLDLRITQNSNTYYPWKLSASNPSATATRSGENNVDNVQFVTIDNPVADATYSIIVDHDGTLDGASQAYSIVISGIKAQSGPTAPIANFSGSITNINVGDAVSFTDLSSNAPTSWSWSFTGGTPSTSTTQNPSITYNTAGTYQVSLTATNAAGSNTKTVNAYITVSTSSCTVSSFPWNEGFENAGQLADCWVNEHVTDTQNWSFQSGGQSGNPSSAHTGSYNAYLYNASTTANITKLVSPQLDLSAVSNPELNFWHTQEFWSPDQDHLKVYYKTSASGSWTLLQEWTNNITAWTEETISLPNKSATYYIAFEGRAQYGRGVCIDDVQVSSTVLPSPPVADFSAASTVITVGESIQFSDLSSNTPTSWSWSFVGGTPTSSTVQNPSITYNTAGTYQVSLTASNSGGSDVETKSAYIIVNSAPVSYCTAQGNNFSYEWISSVSINSYTNNSAGNNYSDYTSEVISLNAGSNSLSLTPAFSSTVYNEIWRVWIDWNKDGDFTDVNEEVYASASSNTTVSGSFNTLAGFSGQTRMRISMKWNGTPTSCESFSYGEVEDYTVNFVASNEENSFGFDQLDQAEISLYPNPAHDYFVLQGDLIVGSEMYIFDVNGKQVMQMNINETLNTISTIGFDPGVYIVRLLSNSETINKKIIIK